MVTTTRKRSVWQNILPLLKVSLKKNCPTGLSIMSGKRDPTKRSLISIRVTKEVSHDALCLGDFLKVGTIREKRREGSIGSFSVALEKRLPLTTPAKSTAAPNVIPVCPNTNILISLLPNDNRQNSNWQFTEITTEISDTVEQLLVLLPH